MLIYLFLSFLGCLLIPEFHQLDRICSCKNGSFWGKCYGIFNWVVMGYSVILMHVSDESWLHYNGGLFCYLRFILASKWGGWNRGSLILGGGIVTLAPRILSGFLKTLKVCNCNGLIVFICLFLLYLSSFFNSSVFTFQVLLLKRLYCCSDTCNPWVKILLIWSFFAATDSLTSSVFHFYFFSLDYLHFFRLPKLNSLFVCGKA